MNIEELQVPLVQICITTAFQCSFWITMPVGMKMISAIDYGALVFQYSNLWTGLALASLATTKQDRQRFLMEWRGLK